MENKIDKIINLSNNQKYMIMDQCNYDNKCYFFVSLLDENGNLTEKFSILEEIHQDNKTIVTIVKDQQLLDSLTNYFKNRIENDI